MNGRIVRASLLALLLSLLAVATISAHANLVRSDPAAGTLLGQAPDQIKLWFDEPVELEFSQVQVIDQNRNRMDLGKLQYLSNDHQAISAPLKPLPDGSYSVIWRVLSAADGHVTTSVFAFSVGNVAGNAPAPIAATNEGESETSPVTVATRWVNLLATLTFVGGFLFRLLLLDRGARLLKIDIERLTRSWQQLMDVAFIGALSSAVVGLILQASLVANVPVAQALAFDPLARTLVNTNFGVLWMIRNGAILAIDLLFLVVHRITRRYLPVILGALALLTYSLGSHNAGIAGMFSALVLSDWFHLLAVALWVGGLFHFLVSVWTARRALEPAPRARWIAWMIPQFSTLAIVATAVIAFTGLVSILAEARTLDQVLGSRYGQTLIIKVALFFVMVGFGAVNLLWLTPRFRKAVDEPMKSGSLYSRFRLSITAESMFGAGVFLLAALLTLTPPPRSQPAQSAPAVASKSIYLEQRLSGDVHVELVIRPALDNPIDFDAHVTNAKTNTPVSDIQRVIFVFTYLDSDTGIARVNADMRPDGHFTVTGNQTPLDGMWLVEVIVRRQGLEDTTARFPLLRGKAQVKPTEPAAMQLLQVSDTAMNALISVRSSQVLNDGTNGSLVTDYTFHAPNEMSYVVKGVGASIAIGPLQYYQEKDGSWTARERIQPLVFPSFTNSKDASVATMGRAAVLSGEETQIVRYRIGTSGGDVTEFAAWVSNQDKRVRQFAMVAPSHFMVQTYYDYDASNISIAAPANVALPTPAPTPVTASIPAPTRTRAAGPITGDLEADIALVVMVAGIIVGLASSDRKRPRRWRLIVLGTAIVLIAASIYLFVDSVSAQQNAVANTPIDVSAADAGEKLYEQNCLSCHGASAKGDGPAAASLPTKPFDLTVHVPQHDDLYLLTTISNGRGYMPAWKDKLTPGQIQQIISYLRVVALKARQNSPALTSAPGFTPGP